MIRGIHLTLMMGPVVPVPVPKVVLEALDAVEVQHNTDQPSVFQLTFKFSSKSILNTILLLMGDIGPIIRTVLVVTHNGLPTVLMDGVITDQQVTPDVQSGQTTLTLTGEDLSKLMDLIQVKGIPYPGMPPSARAAVILAKYAAFGIIPVVIPSILLDVPLPTSRIPTQNVKDRAYLNRLANEVGYVFYVDPGPVPGTSTAFWGPEVKIGLGVPQPALSINMDAHTNVESLNVRFDGSRKTLPILNIHNPETKITIPIPLPDVTPLSPPLGLVPPPPKNIQFLETGRLSPIQAALIGIAKAAKSADVVSATGSLNVLRYGHILKARQLVGLRGAGIAFDGLFFVKSVKHQLKRGEYKQDFTLTRNALVSNVPAVPV
ncbi:MAG: hypothetical protein DHS20C20_11980 [Ardenticatenaceae bacterium]|nr:MAG: hypothetical protein DHS20C20_11980 [Ardenticatenaceae bacterium]